MHMEYFKMVALRAYCQSTKNHLDHLLQTMHTALLQVLIGHNNSQSLCPRNGCIETIQIKHKIQSSRRIFNVTDSLEIITTTASCPWNLSIVPYPLVFLSRPHPDIRRVEIGRTPVCLGTNKHNINQFLDYFSPAIFTKSVPLR